MTDVFISYAREDRKFVQRLHDALASAGRESWVDWEGIPASAKWMAEVRAAIDEADCFCFVVSPDSVESPVCREEAAHAAASNKRILPLLHRAVDDGLVPETVAAHNWIEFDHDADFEKAFATLVKALETEPEHLRTHTRLLVKAKEWDTSRDRSLLLRGSDLTGAESWLGSSQGKEPAPTQLHTAYVLASRKTASRRQRTTMGAVAIALVLSLVLATVAVIQRSQAQDAQAVAEDQAQIANSRALAAQALVHMDRELDLAILLSLEAYRTSPTAEALEVLHIAAQRSIMIERTFTASGTEGVEFSQAGRIALAYSPDGELVALGGADGRVSVWAADTGEAIGEPIGASTGAIHAIAFAPEGEVLAIAGEAGTVTLLDPLAGSEVAAPVEMGDPVTALTFAPDGRSLAIGTDGGEVSLVDAVDGSMIVGPAEFGSGGFHSVSGMAFSPDGEMLAVGSETGELTLVDPGSLRTRASLNTNALAVWAPEFSPDGKTLAAGILARTTGGDGAVLLWDVASGRLLQRLQGHTDQVFDVSFKSDGRMLASGSADATVRLWDLATGVQIGAPLTGHSDDVHAVAFDPTGDDLISGSSDGSLIVWDAGARLVGGGGPVNIVAFTDDGSRLISTEPFSYGEPVPPDPAFEGGGGALIRWDTASWSMVGEPIHGEYVYGLAVGPDGNWFAGGTVDGRVLRWDVEGGAAADDTLPTAGDVLFGLAVSPDGALVAGSTFSRGVSLWDLATGEFVREPLPGYDDGVYGLAFAPDGETLATGDWTGRVRLWDTGTWEPIGGPLAEGLQRSYAVTFNRDGSMLAAAGFDGSVILWDTSSWERVRETTIDNAVLSLAFSPDGRVLAAGTEAGEVEFLDVETGQRIGGAVAGQRDWVNTVAFAPDGRTLAAGSDDGSIALVDASAWTDDVEVLADELCLVAGRGFTDAEWDEFVDFKPYEPACPSLGGS